MNDWVKVTFYGQLPLGQAVEAVDPLEVAERLGEAFGFKLIDGLSMTLDREGPTPAESRREVA